MSKSITENTTHSTTDTTAHALDAETIGFACGAAIAKRDGHAGVGVSVDELTRRASTGVDNDELRTLGAMLAPTVIEALDMAVVFQDRSAGDTSFQADCARFAEGFAQGYIAACL